GGSGPALETGRAVAVDVTGNVYVAGYSPATWGSPVRAFSGGPLDVFAAKLDSSGNLIWNTFLGAGGTDYGWGVGVDISGDVFAAKLNSGGALTWNTFLGGGGSDFGAGVTVDASGNVYVGGYSAATWGSPTRGFNGGLDVFAAKLDSGGALTWNTFLGSGSS